MGVLLLLVVATFALLVIHERTYLRRLVTFPSRDILEVDWFVPKEPVRGGDGPP